MGLIKEPENVDFYVIDKPWTAEEKKEFSEFIKQRKKELGRIKQRIKTRKKVVGKAGK